MADLVWNTIEVRIVCIENSFETSYDTKVPNIFNVLSYDQFMRGEIAESYNQI